jgi:tetratricopeptide (TPR) repeat protein
LREKGDLEGAIAEYEQVLRLDPKYSWAEADLRRVRRMREVLPRLAGVLAGKDQPNSPAEGCAFAYLCSQHFQKRYVQAVRLYANAFAADPKLLDDWQAEHGYSAAVCAVRAAGGEGEGAPAEPAGRSALQARALGWLRVYLALARQKATSAQPADRKAAAESLEYWLGDADLSAVREAGPLAKLPEAEREQWEKLWADVKATPAEAQKPAPPQGAGPDKK